MSISLLLHKVQEVHAHPLSGFAEWLPGIELTKFGPRDIVKLAREHGARIGVTQVRFSRDEAHQLLSMAQACPEIDAAFPWVNLRQPKALLEHDLATLIDTYGYHFAGMRHLVQFEGPHWLSLNDTQAGIDVWEETGKPFKICVFNHQIGGVMDFITGKGGMKRRDKLSVIIDHLFKERCVAEAPSSTWLEAIDVLVGYPNLVVQFSGIFGEQEDISWFSQEGAKIRFKYLIDKLGSGRVIFGSDTPMHHVAYQTILEVMVACGHYAGLSQEQFNDVMGGNLRRICKLPE